MDPREGIMLALQQIRAQKLKSFFAVLGVIIGVMFLITVVSVVEGMNRYVKEDFAKVVYGLNTVTVRRFPSVQIGDRNEAYWRALNRRPLLSFVDAERIKRDLDVPGIVAVSSSSGGRIDGPNGAAVENVWIEGVDVNFLKVRQYDVAKGRMFSAPRTGWAPTWWYSARRPRTSSSAHWTRWAGGSRSRPAAASPS